MMPAVAQHNLVRNDATIHRAECHHYLTAVKRGSRLATRWDWPNQFETLADVLWALPPWLNACKTCDPFEVES